MYNEPPELHAPCLPVATPTRRLQRSLPPFLYTSKLPDPQRAYRARYILTLIYLQLASGASCSMPPCRRAYKTPPALHIPCLYTSKFPYPQRAYRASYIFTLIRLQRACKASCSTPPCRYTYKTPALHTSMPLYRKVAGSTNAPTELRISSR